MTDPTRLLALAEECEKATGPDPELVKQIAIALGWRRSGLSHWQPPEADPAGVWRVGLPDWLGSLDAALSLVRPGRWWMVERRPGHTCYANISDDGEGTAPTPPLALCAAALRVLAEEASDAI